MNVSFKSFRSNGIRPKPNLCGSVLIFICLCSFASASQQSPSPDLADPHGNPNYKALKLLVQAGLVHFPTICYPSDRGAKYDGEHRRLTRWEFAVVTQRALAELKRQWKPLPSKQTAQEMKIQQAANTLAVEFKNELAQRDGI